MSAAPASMPRVQERSRWVLISDGGPGQARSTLAAVRALAAAGYHPVVTTSGDGSLAASSRFCAKVVEVPRAGNDEYAAELRRHLGAGYLTLLPASDAALLALDAPAARLVDKVVLEEEAGRAGIATPPSFAVGSHQELLEISPELEFPVVVKPSVKHTIAKSHSAKRFDSRAALESIDIKIPVVIQPYISDPLRAVCGVMWNGKLAAVAHQRYERTWPDDCGTASAAVTTAPDLMIEERLEQLLAGHDGVFQAQLAGNYLLDLNPRVYGSLPLAVTAGTNLPAIVCDLIRGEEPHLRRAREGVFYRWIEGDVRHALNAFRTKGIGAVTALKMLSPHRGTAHSTESLADPWPMLSRLRHAARRSR